MKVVIATGGSGGHLFPALEVAKELRAKHHDVLFVGALSRSLEKMTDMDFACFELPVRGVVGKSFGKKIKSLALMVKSIWIARRIIKDSKADAVLGFGGYGAFPGVMAAILTRTPSMIHEQNVEPGEANALLGKWVKKVAISFEEARNRFKKDNIVVTGCPAYAQESKKSREEIINGFGLKSDVKTILVFGGSQGSKAINDCFLKAAELLKDEMPFQVIHSCGFDDFKRIEKLYKSFDISCALFPFLDKMGEAYQVSDLVISRAGAMTVTELAKFHKRAIFIPYPHANAHQKANAHLLEARGMAEIIEEKYLTPKMLVDKIKNNIKTLNTEHSKNTNDLYQSQAAKKIADELVLLTA